MTTIFVNNSGTPILTDKGSLLLGSGQVEVIQRIYNVLLTQLRSEIFDPEYGLDHELLITTPGITSEIVRALVIDALNPSNLIGIDEVNSIVVTLEDEIAYVSVNVSTDNDENVVTNISLEV